MVFVPISVSHPKLAALWDEKQNVEISEVSAGSNQNFSWKCVLGHGWVAKPNALKRTQQCPVCSGHKIFIGFNDLATTHPVLAEEWHPTKNVDVVLTEVTYGSKRKVWWLGVCGHEWEATVLARSSGQGCAVCRGLQIQIGVNDIATTHPELVEEWHPTKNGILLPTSISAGSNRKVWWLGACGHEWEVSPLLRTRGNKCYQCLGRRKSSRQPKLVTLPIYFELHPTKNTGLNVADLTLKSNKKVWWLGECGHEWEAKIVSRVSGQGCAVCHGSQVQHGVNDIVTLFPELVKEWDFNLNSKTPNEVTRQSHFKAHWVCSKNHSWEAKVQDRVRGSGCPQCTASVYVSKNEKEIANYITSIGVTIETSVRNIIKGELDIYIPEKNIAVEYNGLYWHSEAAGKTKTYHYDKWKACKEKGIQLIQIWEDDWNRNPELIKRMLAYKMGVTGQRKVFARDTKVDVVESSVARVFLEENHLQGYRAAKYFGLVEKEGLEVFVALFGVQKKGEDQVEIIRFASSVNVVGGFSKLLKHVLSLPEYAHVKEVVSYSHNDHSDGGVYKKNGFVLMHSGSPGYSYWKNGWGVRQNRLKFSPSRMKLNNDMVFVEGSSERELAELNGLTRVWDSGSSLWVKKV